LGHNQENKHDHLVQVGQTAHMGRLQGLLSLVHRKLEHTVVQHMDHMHSTKLKIKQMSKNLNLFHLSQEKVMV
jgi:hypothetical protein